MNLNNLTQVKRNEIANVICEEIAASEAAKGSLPRRWQRNKDIYECVPGVTNLNVIEGMESYSLPLARQKGDRIVGSIMADITALFPYVQVIEEGPDGTNAENIEHSLQAMAKRAGFDEALDYSLLISFLTNLGGLRVRPLTGHQIGEDGMVNANAVTGVEIDWHDPRDLCCYPQYFGDFEHAKTVGHRDYELLYRVRARMAKPGQTPEPDQYYCEDIEGGDDPKSTDDGQWTGSGARRDRTETDTQVGMEDSFVERWEVVTELDLEGDGQHSKYLCVVARRARKLLRIQEYKYPKNWYVEVRLLNSGKQIWCNDSVAQTLQGLNMAFSDIHTILIHGSMGAAFPPLGITAGALPTTTKQYGPGMIFELAADAKLQSIPISFNPEVLPEEADAIERLADAVSGISALGTAENMPSGTTATAAQGFLQGQQEAKSRYTAMVAPSVERVWELLYMFLKAHFPDLKAAFGPAIPIQDYQEIAGLSCRFEATGRSGASNPTLQIQKLQMLYQMAQNPASQLDQSKIEDRIADALDLPFSISGLKKEQQSDFVAIWTSLKTQGIDPMQVVKAGMQSMQQPDKPQKPPVEMISYKDAPPSIQAQMEMQAGMQPAPEHERQQNIDKTNHLIDAVATQHNTDRTHEQAVVTAERSHELAVKAANKPTNGKPVKK